MQNLNFYLPSDDWWLRWSYVLCFLKEDNKWWRKKLLYDKVYLLHLVLAKYFRSSSSFIQLWQMVLHYIFKLTRESGGTIHIHRYRSSYEDIMVPTCHMKLHIFYPVPYLKIYIIPEGTYHTSHRHVPSLKYKIIDLSLWLLFFCFFLKFVMVRVCAKITTYRHLSALCSKIVGFPSSYQVK